MSILGYLPDGDPRNEMDAGHVTGSTVMLAGLDAFVATKVSYLREDGSDK